MELCVRDFCSLLNENNRFRCNVRQIFQGTISEYLPIKPGCIEFSFIRCISDLGQAAADFRSPGDHAVSESRVDGFP